MIYIFCFFLGLIFGWFFARKDDPAEEVFRHPFFVACAVSLFFTFFFLISGANFDQQVDASGKTLNLQEKQR